MNKLTRILFSFAMASSLVTTSMTSFGQTDAIDPSLLSPKQVLNYNFSTIGTLDPTQLQFTSDFTLSRMLFDTLIRQDRQGNFIPSAAQSYEKSTDDLTWTFHLRHNAKWSDGKPVVSSDFVYAWQRLADPKTAAPYSYYLPLMNLKNSLEVINGKLPVSDLGVHALDDYTLTVSLSQATPWLISMLPLSVLAPLRKDVIEANGIEWTHPEHLVVNGPFKVVTYRVNDVLTLQKNPEFWDAKNTHLTQINLDFISDPTANYYGFLSGKYLTTGIPANFKEVAFKEHHKDLIYIKRDFIDYLIINSHAVKNQGIRKAIALLINRKIFTNRIIKYGNATTKIAPTSIQGGKFINEQPWFTLPYNQRVQQAQDLIAKAGFTKEHPLVLEYLTGSPKSDKLFITLQNWLNLGSKGAIQLKIKGVEGKIYFDYVARHQFDLTNAIWVADYPHITSFLYQFTCNNVVNKTNFCSKEYEDIIAQANKLNDPEQRAKLYAQAQQLVADDYQVIPIFQSAGFSLKNPRLQGFNPYLPYSYAQDYYILKDIPACYNQLDGNSMCGTDLTEYFKNTNTQPPTIPMNNPYKK